MKVHIKNKHFESYNSYFMESPKQNRNNKEKKNINVSKVLKLVVKIKYYF